MNLMIVNIEIPFMELRNKEDLVAWVELAKKLQKEYNCDCNLSVKA